MINNGFLNTVQLALIGVLAAVLTGVGGFAYGTYKGAISARKVAVTEQQSAELDALRQVLATHQQLIDDSNKASQTLRKAARQRQIDYSQANKELQNALQKTAASRAGCKFDAGVMRQLSNARDQAASQTSASVSAE